MGLLERFKWVLEHRVPNQSQWALMANRHRTHVERIMTRLTKNPGAEVEVGTLIALAKAAGVDAGWFLTGSGSPDAVAVIGGATPLRDLLDWYYESPVVVKATELHRDITVDDLLRYRASGKVDEGADPEEVYARIKALRPSGDGAKKGDECAGT